MYWFIIFTECKPYSKDRCKDLGKQMLRTFSEGTWSTKGCYLYYNKRYGSKIYWSNGGDKDGTKEQIEKEKQEIKQSSKQKRPPGLDCSTGLVVSSIWKCKPFSNLIAKHILIVTMFSLYLLDFSEFCGTINLQ